MSVDLGEGDRFRSRVVDWPVDTEWSVDSDWLVWLIGRLVGRSIGSFVGWFRWVGSDWSFSLSVDSVYSSFIGGASCVAGSILWLGSSGYLSPKFGRTSSQHQK